MNLDDLAGKTEVFPLEAAQLVRAWFDPDDLVYLTGKKTIKTLHRSVISQGATAREMVELFSSEEGNQFLASLTHSPDGTLWDIYLNVAPVRAPLTNISERVKEATISRVIGIIADLDVKPGGFPSLEAILTFLTGLPHPPTAVVATGSGGAHAYWKFERYPGRDITTAIGKDTALRWWSYLEEQALNQYAARIDRLFDMARMLRLPGTIRWPKKSETAPAACVRLLWCDGPSVGLQALTSASEASWGRHLESINKTRQVDRQRHFDADQLASLVMNASDNKWANYMAIAQVEDFFNEYVTWDDVLNKAGWTKLREDSAGRIEWCRPGRDEKSATVDWPESPHVMSLLSTSYETGLSDLQSAGIPLTKWRVALRLLWQDNYNDMVRWTLSRMGI